MPMVLHFVISSS
ncbi:hypothetical protein A2U01_0087491, partial [Trifolium medium]|nr:hypothetical protein [Trifolium medium]